MDDIVEALRAEQAALAAMVEPLDAGGLSLASRCEGWTVADVLLHLAQTNELAVASATERLDAALASGPDIGRVASIDDWAGAIVAAERGDDLLAVRDRWAASAEAQADAFAAADPRQRVQWVAGDMAARTLATTRLTETWIHAGDVALGLGVAHPPTDRLWHVARLVHRTVPYAFARAGREPAGDVRFELDPPSGGRWVFGEDGAATVVRGSAVELCEVAGQRRAAADTGLHGSGPDLHGVLELMRTFA